MTVHEAELPRLKPKLRSADRSRQVATATPRPLATVHEMHDWVIESGASASDFVTKTPKTSRLAAAIDAVHASSLSVHVLVIDALVIFGAAVLAGMHLAAAVLSTLATLAAFYLFQVYAERDPIQSKGVAWYFARLVIPLGGVTAVGLVASSFADRIASLFGLCTLLGLVLIRCLAWSVLHYLRVRGRAVRRTLIVGTGPVVSSVARKLRAFPQVGLVPIGSLAVTDVLAEDGLASVIRVTRTDHVILAPELGEEGVLVESIRHGGGSAATFSLLPPLPDLFLHPASTNELGGLPLVPLGRLLRRRRAFAGKRAFDILVGVAMLVAFLPVMVVTAFAIKLDTRGPVFYKQFRVGRDGQMFRVIKFRSMVVGADLEFEELRRSEANVSDGLLFKHLDDHRVTRVGRFIRRHAIDELPQLLNVLTGSMSLVGPRPLAVEVDEFDTLEHERHSTWPGMTGYWQVSGGNELTYHDMVRLDLAYIRNWTMWLDVRLLVKTIPTVLNGRRVS